MDAGLTILKFDRSGTIIAERAILAPERAPAPYNIGCPPVTGTTAPEM